MRRPAVLTAFALAFAACHKSPCQELGERLCACQPNISSDQCKNQVQNIIKDVNPSSDQEDKCDQVLGSCREPPGALFCEWLLTDDGKRACGLAPQLP